MRRYIGQILFFILLTFCGLSYPQSVNTKNLLDTYKDFYHWQEEKNNLSNSDSILTILGRWAYGPCWAVDAKDNLAFIGNGPTFQILDISDPTSPEIIGEYLADHNIYDIEISGNTAFLLRASRLMILDITDPSSPVELSFILINGGAISFALEGFFAYVITVSGTMRVVDISDSHNPFLRGITSAGGEWPAFVEARNSFVYIGNTTYPDLTIIDATNPDTLINYYFDINGFGMSSFIKDTLLFIGVSYTASHLKIYNIAKPAEPEFINQLEINNTVTISKIEIAENGDIAYISSSGNNSSAKIYSIDISDLSQPIILDIFERGIQRGISALALTQNTLAASYSSEVGFIDVSDPDSLALKSFSPTGGSAEKIQLKDSLAFVASGLAGLWILDISNPEKPISISNINTGGYTLDVIVEDTLAYIINNADYTSVDTRGLWIINISDIYKPIALGYYLGNPNSISKSGNLILLTQSPSPPINNILEIIDATNPYEPVSIGIFQGNYYPHNTVVNESIVYLATSNRGLRFIDIRDPSNPFETGFFQDSTFLVGIFVKDDLAYADRIDTLFVLDISNPIQPVILGKMGRNSGSFSGIDLFVEDNFLYWAEWILGVVDVSDPENPIQVTTFEGKDRGRGVAAAGNKIFFADQTQGVWVLRNNLITNIKDDKPVISSYKLYQNYPNPFNPVTIIEFEIPQKEKVLIEVFDLLGKRIKILLNEEMEIGRHKINFNAVGLSSGIYFYRIRTKETTVTKKMVLLR